MRRARIRVDSLRRVPRDHKAQTPKWARALFSIGLPLALLLLLKLVFVPAADPGSVSVEPDTGIAGDYGTWIVTFEVGDRPFVSGGAIRVQLPDSWHAGERNSAIPLQGTDPTADHYVSASASRSDVRLQTTVEFESRDFLVKQARPSLDGRMERYVFVVRVELLEGRLETGDSIYVTYGDTSQGSRGMQASVITTGPEPILVAIDPSGSGQFQLHSDSPMLECESGPPAKLLAYAPSTAAVGDEIVVDLVVVDRLANPVPSFEGEAVVNVLRSAPADQTGRSVRMTAGRGQIAMTAEAPGILVLEASAMNRLLKARTNPVQVSSAPQERDLYWGDLHSHTTYSWDGVGNRSFEYARSVSALDFYAMTDHSITPDEEGTRGLSSRVWDQYVELAEKHNDPGRFVTLHAYEASFGRPYGHHNVYFRGKPGSLLAPDRLSLPDFWKELSAGEALTIPHHTGKMPSPLIWSPQNPEFRRNIEIYSAHGLSEVYDPTNPLSFENSDFTAPARSVDGAQFAQDAWMEGLQLSSIASSDDHRAQPGKPHWGLVAVRAKGLTREEIFDAIYERRTYATTGSRIILDFSVSGAPMGQEVEARNRPLLEVTAHGTDEIDAVEILRYASVQGGFQVIFRMEPGSQDFEWSTIDESFREDSIYYVRVKQAAEVWGRAAMAWSSPVWVTKTE